MAWSARKILAVVTVLVSVLALLAGTGYALVASDAAQLGWQPLLVLWGGGDAATALRELRRITHASGVAIHHTQIDGPTQEFLDDLLGDLEDFNLADLYDRLPEKNGPFRELWVRGELEGGKYLVRRSDEPRNYQVTLRGQRNQLAAMSTTVRAKEIRVQGDKRAYFLGYRAGLGVGAVRWDRAMNAWTDLARLVGTGDPRAQRGEVVPPSSNIQSTVRTLNPRLGAEDLEVLSLLFESYPAFSSTLARLGEVEDLRTVQQGSYQQVNVALRGLPERFGKHYPRLARYLARLGPLARADLRWVDRSGRTLMHFKLNSEDLTVSAKCYVKDGQLLPFTGSTVHEAEPIDPFSPLLAQTKYVGDLRFKMLGVGVKLSKFELDAWYEPHPGYAQMGVRLTRVPAVRVDGAALGFLPTGFVDAFIPGNMEGITREFLEVAAKGNGGKGVVANFNVGIANVGSTQGVAETSLELDALDNFLVKLGVGMVNDRVIPNDAAIAEAKDFAGDLHDAFVRDLARFETRCNCGAGARP